MAGSSTYPTKLSTGEGWVEYFITETIKGILKVEEWIYRGKSKFQRVEIFRHKTLGKCLLLDSVIQLASFDEHIYHEMLVHPAMLMHPKPKRVLILGGGDGCALREVLKHPSVEKAVLVDIDEEVVEVSKRYLADLNQNSLLDPRTEVVIEDGRKFVEEYEGKPFDVIISDLTDPIGPSALLYTKEFYGELYRILGEGGCLVVQAQSIDYYRVVHASVYRTLKSVFEHVTSYAVPMLSFSMIWAFVLASNKIEVERFPMEIMERRMSERGVICRYFSPRKYELARHTIRLVEEELYREGRLSTDSNPITIKEVP